MNCRGGVRCTVVVVVRRRFVLDWFSYGARKSDGGVSMDGKDRGWRGGASYFVTHHDKLGHACRRSTLTERVPCRILLLGRMKKANEMG